MAKKGEVKILHPDWCKACGICVMVCPMDVLALESSGIRIVNGEDCIGCNRCELSCPDFVLKVVENSEEKTVTG